MQQRNDRWSSSLVVTVSTRRQLLAWHVHVVSLDENAARSSTGQLEYFVRAIFSNVERFARKTLLPS
jgi:DNA invertase Pin-like site-specific DNA recombinase